MPSQQEVRWSQLKVGLIVLAVTIILVTLLFLITSFFGIGIFSHKLTVTTYFENSAGLKEGAAVNLQGVTVGTVKWYVTQIYAKLGVRSRVQAMVRARELKLLTKGSETPAASVVQTEDFQPEKPSFIALPSQNIETKPSLNSWQWRYIPGVK